VIEFEPRNPSRRPLFPRILKKEITTTRSTTLIPLDYRIPQRIGSFHVSLKWRLVLFANQYTPAAVFLIWDSLFLGREILYEFCLCLTSAHLKRIRLSGEKSTAEQIQNWDQWNCEELVKDAVKSLDERRIMGILDIGWGELQFSSLECLLLFSSINMVQWAQIVFKLRFRFLVDDGPFID
jgi:hypothetical protein